MDFSKQIVVVTGASGNLGQAVSRAFAARGASLVLIGRDRARLEQVFGTGDERRLVLPLDLTNAEQTMAAAGTMVERFGRIDALCNVAGGFRMGPAVHQTPDADWDYLFDINVRSMMNTVRAVVPNMIEQGSGKIINVAANSALKGAAKMGAYCASKDAVIRLTEAMAAELRDHQINVNCVLPSIIDTPENRAAMPHADFSRWVSPEALADVMLFLASDAARAIHGVALPVTGRS